MIKTRAGIFLNSQFLKLESKLRAFQGVTPLFFSPADSLISSYWGMHAKCMLKIIMTFTKWTTRLIRANPQTLDSFDSSVFQSTKWDLLFLLLASPYWDSVEPFRKLPLRCWNTSQEELSKAIIQDSRLVIICKFILPFASVGYPELERGETSAIFSSSCVLWEGLGVNKCVTDFEHSLSAVTSSEWKLERAGLKG